MKHDRDSLGESVAFVVFIAGLFALWLLVAPLIYQYQACLRGWL